MSGAEKYLATRLRTLSQENWDSFVRWLDARFRPLEDRAAVDAAITDRIVSRGLSVIEERLSPAILQAESKAAVAAAIAAEVEDILAGLNASGIPAATVIESTSRRFISDATLADLLARQTESQVEGLIAAALASTVTGTGVLTLLRGVDGVGSLLDADLVRGSEPSPAGLAILAAASAAAQRLALGATGNLLRVNRLTLSGDYAFLPEARWYRIKLQGPGGAGGGAAAAAGQVSLGGPGGAGAYCEGYYEVPAGRLGTYIQGAPGAAIAGANGNAGGQSSWADGVRTLIAPGGPGGLVGVSTASAQYSRYPLAPAVGSGANLHNGAGDPGRPTQGGVVSSTIDAYSGEGGHSRFGPGGRAFYVRTNTTTAVAENGYPALGPGAGGGGAAVANSTAARSGGLALVGFAEIEEFG